MGNCSRWSKGTFTYALRRVRYQGKSTEELLSSSGKMKREQKRVRKNRWKDPDRIEEKPIQIKSEENEQCSLASPKKS